MALPYCGADAKVVSPGRSKRQMLKVNVNVKSAEHEPKVAFKKAIYPSSINLYIRILNVILHADFDSLENVRDKEVRIIATAVL